MKTTLLAGAALCLFSGAAQAQTTSPCPAGTTNCTISNQDAGHNETQASASNTNTTSSIAGTSSASNQSGNTISPSFDNSAQTTQNATTTTGAIDSSSNGNTSSNANQSSASNGQSNTGTSTNTLGGSSSGGNTLGGSSSGGNTVGGSTSGGNTLATGPSTSSTGASTSSTGAINSSTGASTSSTGASTAYLGGNTQANGSASTVGATTSTSGANRLASDASNSGGNSSTSVDASDHSSYRSKAIFIPPVVPITPPSQLAVGNIIKETSACGPLQHIVRQQVTGTFIGLLRSSSVPQGWSDDLEPFRDANGAIVDYRQEMLSNGDIRLFGNQVIMFTTVIGVASNRNIALGGGGGGGSWGQAGMGSSSSNQRMVTNIQLRECEIGTMHMVEREREVAPKAIRG